MASLLVVLGAGCTEGGSSQPQDNEATAPMIGGESRKAGQPGRPVPTPVEGIVVPEGIQPELSSPGYRLYTVPTSEPAAWVDWFVERYPSGQPYRDWMFCAAGHAENGRDMTRSWTRGGLGLLLNVGFVPSEGVMEIIIYRGEFNDCEHHN